MFFLQMSRPLGAGIGTPVNPGVAAAILQSQPIQVAWIMEEFWRVRTNIPGTGFLERPAPANPLPQDPGGIIALFQGLGYFAAPIDWHIMYAFLIENTKIFDVFRKVLELFYSGESLGIPTVQAQLWARATEEIFYRDPPSLFAYSVTSSARPDMAAVRRNAYYRFFGMDLNHAGPDGRPVVFERPETSNRDFVSTFEELLREAWIGIENALNFAGPNPTSDAAIELVLFKLRDMLRDRRLFGNLTREELYVVATMSWLHLSVSTFASPVVQALRAESTTAAGRLMNISKKVGVSMHSKAHHFFELSERVAALLIAIEAGVYDPPGAVQLFYLPGSATRIIVESIITHWSMATGRDLKSQRPTVSAIARGSAPALASNRELVRV